MRIDKRLCVITVTEYCMEYRYPRVVIFLTYIEFRTHLPKVERIDRLTRGEINAY